VTIEDKEPDKWGLGRHGWTEETYIPDVAPDGSVRGFFVLAVDISARKNAEEARRQSEVRFRTIAESIEDVFYMTDLERNALEYVSPSYERVWGRPVSDLMADIGSFVETIHPEDRPAYFENKARQAQGEPVVAEYRIVRPDGEVRWIFDRSFPVAGAAGRRAAGIASDITERKHLQEHERLLLAELQHRVRNTLAVVRSIARRTTTLNDDLEEYRAHFDGRLGAFARTQAAVTRDPGGGVDLETLLAEELTAHGARESGRVRIEGPPLRLQPKAAESLGLAIHELATNSIKYGALSLPTGGLDVQWSVDRNGAGDRLTFRWTEDTPGLRIGPPTHRGFGLDLLERLLAYELGGETMLDFAPDGLRCTVVVPLNERIGRVVGNGSSPA
jgi:PAS domain S-box-containing protein